MNFWKRYPADYRKKTTRLTLAQHGAYSLLLDEIYVSEQPLPAEIGELYRVCAAMNKGERDAVDAVAARFFPIGSDGQRHNKRATEELEEAAPAVEAARANGRKGGRPKSKPSDNPAGFGSENPAGFQNETQKEPSSKAPHSSETPSLRSGEGSRKRAPRFDASAVAIPGWLDAEVWRRWCKDRKDRGKAITEEGAKGQLKRLEAYRHEGVHTPESVLEHAIASGNQGLFPPPITRPQILTRAGKAEIRGSRTAEMTDGIFGGEHRAPEDFVEMEGGGGRIAHD